MTLDVRLYSEMETTIMSVGGRRGEVGGKERAGEVGEREGD